jgi:hypothetical protein
MDLAHCALFDAGTDETLIVVPSIPPLKYTSQIAGIFIGFVFVARPKELQICG